MSTLTTLAQKLGLLDSFESVAVDAYIASAAPRQVGDLVIVTITDDDYRNPDLFGGLSPLNASKLRALVDAIVSGGPAVIGVDVSTADADKARAFEKLRDPRIVWVQDAIQEASGESGSAEARWHLDGVLGRDTPEEGLQVGLSLFPRDSDGFVRRYHRQLPLKTAEGTITRPSLPWSILQRYCAAASSPECGRIRNEAATEGHEALWFNFAGDRYAFRRIPAGAIYQAWVQDGKLPTEDFRGKIVLLGGTFSAARDVYPTPLGQVAGVELTAFAIESELHGGGIRSSNHLLMLIVEFMVAVALVWLNWRWTPGSRMNAVVISMAIPVLAVIGSYIAFRALGYWANFVPIGIGVWLDQLHERAHQAKQAREQLEEYRRRYGPL